MKLTTNLNHIKTEGKAGSIGKSHYSLPHNSSVLSASSSPILRVWYNTLVEINTSTGQSKVLRSYHTVAKDSAVKKATTTKKVKPKPLEFKKVKQNKQEVY